MTVEHVPVPADATEMGRCSGDCANDRARRFTTAAETVCGEIFVDRAEAARRLGLSVRELDRERAKGNILAKRKGAKVLVPVSELERFAASLPWDEPTRWVPVRR